MAPAPTPFPSAHPPRPGPRTAPLGLDARPGGRAALAHPARATTDPHPGATLPPAEPGPDVVLRRSAGSWQVELASGPDAGSPAGEPTPDVLEALTLADVISGVVAPPAAPAKAAADADELARLRVQVAQLEHALSARVVVEQAIGVLAERQRLAPRDAFERLRKVARGRGQKVVDLARAVVATASGAPQDALPAELRSPRTA